MSTRSKRSEWLTFGFGAAVMGFEAQQIIAMRLLKLSGGGPAAAAEFDQMVSEKAKAIAEIGQAAASAALSRDGSKLPANALRVVRGPVNANRKRLAAELLSGRNSG